MTGVALRTILGMSARVLLCLLLTAGAVFALHEAIEALGCNVHHFNNCSYNDRYKLLREHPELGGQVTSIDQLDAGSKSAVEGALERGETLPPWVSPTLEKQLRADMATSTTTR